MRKFALVLFIGLVAGGGLIIGGLTPPSEWYRTLAKPSFNPPNWVFGPVWLFLYVCIGVAGWRVWSRKLQPAQRLWWIQLILNGFWSPVFFGMHSTGGALIIIVLMLAAILSFMLSVRHQDHISLWLFAPYFMWVAFATILNFSIWRLNP